jgi:hypothetical protein
MDTPPVIPPQKPKLSRRGLVIALIINLVVVLSSIPLYRIPSGQKVNGAGWFGSIMFIAAIGFAVAAIGISTARAHRSLRWPWLVVVLGLTPLPLAIALSRHAQWVRGFMFQ